MKNPLIKVEKTDFVPQQSSNSRRQFLKLGGLAVAGSTLMLYGCSSDDDMNVMPTGPVFDLGSGDIGVLNYAYALEQLEAAYYTAVLNGSYWMNSATAEERKMLEDFYKHEVIHRDFFKAAITANASNPGQVLPELEFDFSGVDFGNRDSVLSTAIVLEDTGVSAYNGAGKLLANPDFLVIAGKIVSVEARHASAVRSLYLGSDTAFAADDITDSDGLDLVSTPSEVIQAVGATGFIVTEFTANNLPNG